MIDEITYLGTIIRVDSSTVEIEISDEIPGHLHQHFEHAIGTVRLADVDTRGSRLGVDDPEIVDQRLR